MDTAKVLLLGDSRLRRVSEPVLDICHSDYLANKLRLQRTLEDFRMRHGFGRAISPPSDRRATAVYSASPGSRIRDHKPGDYMAK